MSAKHYTFNLITCITCSWRLRKATHDQRNIDHDRGACSLQ